MKFGQATLTHCCAATGCQTLVPLQLLMCMDHWRQVPLALRKEVWATWRRLERDPQARGPYDAAVAAARDAVHAKQLKRRTKTETKTRPLF